MTIKDKKMQRQEMKIILSQIDKDRKDKAAQHLLQHFLATPYAQYQSFGIYLPIQNEISTVPLINALWSLDKKLSLPCLDDEGYLFFRQYNQKTVLQSGDYGILFPDHLAPVTPLDHLDCLFLPLMAFDKQGHRLGRGKGYYDKTLADFTKPLRIGLAYDCQCLDFIQNDPWDQCLNAVITESEVFVF